MTYLLTFNGSFSKEFYNEERILTGHLMSCYVYDNCCDLFPEAQQDGGDVGKAELRETQEKPVTK